MDIKIDAVFSLAKDDKDGSKTDHTSPPNRVVVKEEVHDPGYDTAMCRDIPERDVKPFQDMDLPPSLSMEKDSGGFRAMMYDSGRESMPPPILEPEMASYPEFTTCTDDPDSQTLNSKKKPCMQILPCYIVLTKVDRQLNSRSSLSYRAFRKHKECLNICKKVHFRRMLKGGLDVFNVKAPSKKSGYKVYLDLRKSRNKQLRSVFSPKMDIRFNDLIRKYAKTVNGRGAGRVMRSVNCLPKDFTKGAKRNHKTPTLTKLLTEAKQHMLTETEREILFKRDLAKLKRQVAFQRSVMKTRKNHRKQQPEKNPTYFKSGTSVVSGRVRKTNTRYGNDFAMTKDEEVYFQSLSTINENLKKETKRIMKETEEHICTDNRVQVTDSTTRLSEVFVDVIAHKDRPPQPHEIKNAICTELRFERRERLNARRREIRRQKAAKKVFNETKDGVIIKEMPNELGALTNLLLEGDNTDTESIISGKQKVIKTERMETEEEEKQYSFAKSIIKRSSSGAPVTSQTPTPPMVRIEYLDATNSPQHKADSNHSNTESSIDDERAQLLRIPEKVRRLFVKKKPEASTLSTKSVTHGKNVLTDKSSINRPGPVPVSIVYPLTKTTASYTPGVSQNLGFFQGNKQTFIITPSGLVKPLCQVWGDIPEKGTSLPAARQLLTQSLSNSSTVSSTQIPITIQATPDQELGKLNSLLPKGNGSGKLQSSVSNAGKPLAPPVSLTTGRPLSILPKSLSETNSGSSVPVTLLSSPGGGVRPSKGPQPIRLANPGPNTGNDNVLYQVHMAGKTLLIPASSVTNQQNNFLTAQVKHTAQTITTACTAATANTPVVTSHEGNAFNGFTPTYSQALYTSTASSTSASRLMNKLINVIPKPAGASGYELPQTRQDEQRLVKKFTRNDGSLMIKCPVSRNSHVMESTGGLAASTDRIGTIRVVSAPDTIIGASSAAATTHPNVRSLLNQSFTLVPANTTQANSSCQTSTSVGLGKSSGPMRFTLVPISMPASTSPPAVSGHVRSALSNSLKRPTTTVPSVVVMRAPVPSSTGTPNQQAPSLGMQMISSQHSSNMPSLSLLGGSSTTSTASTNTMVTRSTQFAKMTHIKQEPISGATLCPRMVLKQEEKSEDSSSDVPSKRKVVRADLADSSVIHVYNGGVSSVKINSKPCEDEDETEPPTKVEEKPLPFTEATTAREERLKKLKALLKERQMAVEKLQKERLNAESDGEK